MELVGLVWFWFWFWFDLVWSGWLVNNLREIVHFQMP
jgi:hypothetical protein